MIVPFVYILERILISRYVTFVPLFLESLDGGTRHGRVKDVRRSPFPAWAGVARGVEVLHQQIQTGLICRLV